MAYLHKGSVTVLLHAGSEELLAGGCSCTFAVDDLDHVVTYLRNLGVETGEEMKSERTRVIMIKDPAGNSLAFAQTLERSMAR